MTADQSGQGRGNRGKDIADDDEIGGSDTETLHSDCEINENGSLGERLHGEGLVGG